jgi:uncharacterized protein involved in exopolysaccharide biosynthesis
MRVGFDEIHQRCHPMSSNLDSDQNQPSFHDVLRCTFASLWRRKLPLGAIVATALAVGITALLVMPKRYTAEAYIQGGFPASNAVAASEDRKSATSSITLDLQRVIETQSSLLQSYQQARRVVARLGLERLQPDLVSRRPWLAKLYRAAPDVPERQEDLAAMELLRGLSVTSDPRAYLIEVRYTGGDAALASLITDAFVAEFLRSIHLQSLYQQRSFAQAALSEQLSTFGDKHPKVIEARTRLAAVVGLLQEQLNEPPEEILQAAGENVTRGPAVLTGPKPKLVIGLSLIVGLMFGIGLALWLERARWWEAVSQYYVRSSIPYWPVDSIEAPGTVLQVAGIPHAQTARQTAVAQSMRAQGGGG